MAPWLLGSGWAFCGGRSSPLCWGHPGRLPPTWLRVFKTNGNQGAKNRSSNKNVSTRVPKKGENRQKVETRVHLQAHGQNGTYCAVGRDSAAERNEAGARAATWTGPEHRGQARKRRVWDSTTKGRESRQAGEMLRAARDGTSVWAEENSLETNFHATKLST